MTAFTVCRENWHAFHAPSPHEPWLARLPGARPLASFADPEMAQAFARDRERALRERVNPFRCGAALADVTSLPAFALKDYLLEDGVKMARPDSRAELHWDRWWERESPKWTPGVRARIWEALDLVRFTRVVARPAGGWAFVPVAALVWGGSRHARGSPAAPEGGRLLGAHPTGADAAAALELFAGGPETQSSPWELRHATGWARDPLAERRRDGSVPREPFDQVVAVPLVGEPPARGGRVWCVARRAMTVSVRTDANLPGPRYSFDAVTTTEWGAERRVVTAVEEFHLVPHAVHADRPAAAAAALELERETRRRVNPLRLSPWDSGGLHTGSGWACPLTGAVTDGFDSFPTRQYSPPPAWWDANARTESEAEFHRLYDRLDRVRYADVAELAWD